MMTRVARGDLAVSFTRFLACLVVEMMGSIEGRLSWLPSVLLPREQ